MSHHDVISCHNAMTTCGNFSRLEILAKISRGGSKSPLLGIYVDQKTLIFQKLNKEGTFVIIPPLGFG